MAKIYSEMVVSSFLKLEKVYTLYYSDVSHCSLYLRNDQINSTKQYN